MIAIPNNQELPPRQKQVFEFVKETILTTGQSPSLKEIAAAIGTSQSPAVRLIKKLIRKGFLIRYQQHRTLTVPGLNTGATVAADEPMDYADPMEWEIQERAREIRLRNDALAQSRKDFLLAREQLLRHEAMAVAEELRGTLLEA